VNANDSTLPVTKSDVLPGGLYSPTQEVRLAVVMYGGVSLAIYMNGISQELLKAVRGTAPQESQGGFACSDDALQSTERVYRQIGQILYHGRKAGEPADLLLLKNADIRTRILIDILAGTSAGGINAVFLAKALANEQDMDQVRAIWLKEGNIDTLLNDSRSVDGRYRSDDPKTSLLNSQRLYGKLLEAFDGMDQHLARQKDFRSRLANEIDLFVTTTDLNGLVVPIQLANVVVEERVHKAHFRFVYGPDRINSPNDFAAAYNPMLAFASRCTSSFPAAFEPMKAEGVDQFVQRFSWSLASDGSDSPMRKFFADFKRFGGSLPFTQRPFADGGYLNNKPFSFAIDAIRFRQSDLPVSRKLLYLDPFPELKTDLARQQSDFSFSENTMLAVSTLPRYQTIREDLTRLNAHNRKIRRVNVLQAEVEKDLPRLLKDCLQRRSERPDRHYEKLDLDGMIGIYGQCYIVYHRLCVSSVTDELALLFTRLFNFNDDSDELYAIRMLVHAWREANYSSRKADSKKTENDFLYSFDLGYRMRRFKYILAEIDSLLKIVSNADKSTSQTDLAAFWTKLDSNVEAATIDINKMRNDLVVFRKAAVDVGKALFRRREQLWLLFQGQEVDPVTESMRSKLRECLEEAQLDSADLRWILSPVSDDEAQDRARQLYEIGGRSDASTKPRSIGQSFAKAAEFVAGTLKDALQAASQDFLNVVNPEGKDNMEARKVGPPVTEIAAHYLWTRYQYFECRDVIMYSIVPEDASGEGCWTEVYRISPIDAVYVYNEKDNARRASKLSGTALMDFGAFLDEGWRKNDIRWGRLDGAERIIESLLPDEADKPLRDKLINQAVGIILEEEFRPEDSRDMVGLVDGFLRNNLRKQHGDERMSATGFLDATKRQMSEHSAELSQALISTAMDNTDRLALFRSYYSKPAGPDLKVSIAWARRAAGIVGEMFGGLDRTNKLNTTLGGWIGRAGSVSTRFIEFALPDTLFHKFCWHWLGLLYVAEVMLILVGTFIYKYDAVETAGWLALFFTGTVHLSTWSLGRWLSSRKSRLRVVFIALLAFVFCLTVASIALQRCQLPPGAWKTPLRTLVQITRSGCSTEAISKGDIARGQK
jgi:patatin-related protein